MKGARFKIKHRFDIKHRSDIKYGSEGDGVVEMIHDFVQLLR